MKACTTANIAVISNFCISEYHTGPYSDMPAKLAVGRNGYVVGKLNVRIPAAGKR